MDPPIETTRETIESIVRPHLKFLDDESPLDPGRNLGEAGLDSMGAIDLLVELESRFGIVIDDESLTETSFASLAEIKRLVDSSRLAT